MCYKKKCQKCGKIIWSKCDKLVKDTLKNISNLQLCKCLKNDNLKSKLIINDPYLSVIQSKCKHINKKKFFLSIKHCFNTLEKFNKGVVYTSTYHKWLDFIKQKELPSNYNCSILDYILCNILLKKKDKRYKESVKNLFRNSFKVQIKNDFFTFSVKDYKWISSIIQYFYRILTKGIKYIDIPDNIIKKYKNKDYSEIDKFSLYNLNDITNKKNKNIKVLLLSDWGSGSPQAEALAKKIFSYSKGGIDLIFHLGDVYYSGTYAEQKKNITNILKKIDKNVNIINIPGNHDYYSGGQGFFKNLKNLNNFQKTSFLCIRGETLQFICLDTSYFDSNPFNTYFKNGKDVKINDNQKKWLERMIETAGNRKTIILSHNELFTHQNKELSDGINLNLYNSLDKNINKVDAWFWGNEHFFSVYKENFLGLKKGRLIGAGAIPVSSKIDPYKIDPNFTWNNAKINKLKLLIDTSYGKNKYTWNNVGVLLNIKPNGDLIAKYLELSVDDNGKIKKLKKIYQENI